MSIRSLALAAALIGGSMAAAGPTSATPVATGLAAGGAIDASIEQAQLYFGFGGPGYGYGAPYYGRPSYGYGRPHYRPYGYYGPGYGYRRRVVCRVRYTPYGPRRVCFRR